MPPSNVTSSGPSHSNPILPLAATTDASSGTNPTPIIIGVSVGAGSLILLIVGYKLWKCFTQRSKAPLPPKGPLAHDRQRQMASAHPKSELNYPHSMEISPPGLTPFADAEQLDDHIRQTSDDSSIPPSSPSVVSSQVHLVQTPTGSEENGEVSRRGRASFSSSSTARPYHHDRRQRTRSASGSVYSNRSRQSSAGGTVRGRGPPHARHSRVDIVLPQPLAPGLYHENGTLGQSEIPPLSRASFYEKEPQGSIGVSDLATARTSVDGPPLVSTEMNNHHPGQYPPPVPPLPVSYHTITVPTVPPPASLPSPDVVPPAPAGRSPSQPTPSPERGLPPLPPPKDSQSRSSRRSRRRSELTQQSQRP